MTNLAQHGNESVRPNHKAQPFLKWAGGKTRLIDQIKPFFPTDYGRYFEPFIGGGAFYFHMQPQEAVISDINERLICAYRTVRDDLPELMERLEVLVKKHSSDHYYRCRERLNHARSMSDVERAALMIYLNKTCFNGLYRENRRGEFNVPIGSYKNPKVFCEDNLEAVSFQLQNTDIRAQSFEYVLDEAVEGDLVYFDPPYVPLNATSSFTSYVGAGFDLQMQQRLAEVFTELAHRGCHVYLSNSDTPVVRELYRGWHIETVRAGRSINSKGSGRRRINEVLVTGKPSIRP